MVNKNVFLQALIATIIIFGIGLLLGFFLENSRTNSIELALLNSELNLLDEQIRNMGTERLDIGCELAKQSTFDFADDIYQEALLLEKYDSANKFKGELTTLHKRYDLLRMSLWLESIELKKTCPGEFHTLIYMFEYNSEDLTTQAEQSGISRLLLDVKNNNPDRVILIPIAGNLDLKSVNLALERFDIDKLPAIIVDEEIVIERRVTLPELESLIFSGNNKKIILNP